LKIGPVIHRIITIETANMNARELPLIAEILVENISMGDCWLFILCMGD